MAFAVLSFGVSWGAKAGIDDAEVRESVQRCLPYVQATGAAWMRDQKCNSCHAVTFMPWITREAVAKGLRVDLNKANEWEDWSIENALIDQHAYRLRPRAVDSLTRNGVSKEDVDKLKPVIDKLFGKEAQFLAAAEKALNAESVAKHREVLLTAATLPKTGSGTDTMAQMLLAGTSGHATDPARVQKLSAVRDLLLEWQEPNGSWEAAGQLPGMRWASKEEADEATTMWCVLALDAVEPVIPGEKTKASRERAVAWLRAASRPSISIQTKALRMAVAHQTGNVAEERASMDEVVARQNADGGWSWVRESASSDPLSTGQVLYLLGLSGRREDDPQVRKARTCLLQTQQPDGRWSVSYRDLNKRAIKLNIYDLWGTEWAALGLLQGLSAATPGD